MANIITKFAKYGQEYNAIYPKLKTINGERIEGEGDIEISGVKVFNVSSATDLTNIQAAYDYMRTGKKCIISMAGYGEFYPHYRGAQWTFVGWLGTDGTYAETEPLQGYFVVTLFLNISGSTVTQARIVSQTQQVVTSLPNNPQANTLYFITG